MGEDVLYLETKLYVVAAVFMKIKAVGVSTPCPLVVTGVSKEVPGPVITS